MPSKPWEFLAMDFYGPTPNNSELMVVVDEFSRMPVVREVKTTGSEYVLPKLDDLFSFVGIPRELKTDNGPPFNGHKFKEFAEYLGFKHRNITPEHPEANGQAENFMKNIGSVIRNSKTEGKNWEQELNSFLRNYRSTPHSSTGVAPSVLLFGANRTNRLPSIIEEARTFDEFSALALNNDAVHKAKVKVYTDRKRRAKQHNFKLGEDVIIRQKRQSKTMTAFCQAKLKIIAIKGSMITVRTEEGKEFSRNASRFRRKTAVDGNNNNIEVNHNDIEIPQATRRSTRNRKQTVFYQAE